MPQPFRLRARCSTRRADRPERRRSSRRRTSTRPPARPICRTQRRRRRPPSRRSRERASRKPPRLRRRGYPSGLCSRDQHQAERLGAEPENGAERPALDAASRRSGTPAARSTITIAPAAAGSRVGGAWRGSGPGGQGSAFDYMFRYFDHGRRRRRRECRRQRRRRARNRVFPPAQPINVPTTMQAAVEPISTLPAPARENVGRWGCTGAERSSGL